MIGGFLDGYRDSIPRFFEYSKAPHQSVARPVESHFPARSRARPFDRMARGGHALVGLLAEGQCKTESWTSHASKCTCATGIRPIPTSRKFPAIGARKKPGRLRTRTRRLFSSSRITSLGDAPPPASSRSASHQLKYVPSIGSEAGFWWGDLTADQRPIDAYSLGLRFRAARARHRDSRLAESYSCRFHQARRSRIGSCAFLTWRPTAR